jgi:thiamine transport system substrate-binding protein
MFKIVIFITLLSYLGCSDKKEYLDNNNTLTIYTYDSFASKWGPAPKIKEVFEKKHNCKIHFVGVSSSIGALRKIQLEGKNTKADILLGLDTATANIANKTGLFEAHGLKDELDLPTAYEDENFTPYDYSYFAFVYDKNRTSNPPHSFEELANMPEDFKIVIQDPRSSTSGLGLLLWIKSIYKDKADEYWHKLSPYILTVTKGWSESYNLFLKGEADMALSYTTSPAYHMIQEKKNNIKATKFKEGHYLQIEVAAMLKSSTHKKLAKEFLSFLHSSEFAKIIPTTNWAYPVVKAPLPKEFETLMQPKKPLLIDSTKRESYINEWLKAIKR